MLALSVRDLKKTYRNSVHALRGVSFDVEEGDFFALLGPNGAGKTTLIGVLTSLVNKTTGKISIFGHDIDKEFSLAKKCIGVVPQEFNFGIFEKVESIIVNQAGYYGIPRALAKQRAEKYLKQLDLWGKRHTIARNLSGGMKRRLMIARAMIHEPRMLVLDEPTAGVDVELRRSMWGFLKKINQSGVTIILTTHYLEEAENLCRNIAIIDQGEIVENSEMNVFLQRLDVDTYILYLSEPYTKVPELPGARIVPQDKMTLEVEVNRAYGMTKLIDDLKDHGIFVTSMRNKVNRLEELFISITNREGK